MEQAPLGSLPLGALSDTSFEEAVVSAERLEQALSPDVYRAMADMFAGARIDISADQWVTIVYDMIAAFKAAEDRNALVESLKGLYFGRALAFMNKTWDWSTEQAEEEILKQAEVFHARRDYLIAKLDA